MTSTLSPFDRLVWRDDEMLLDDLVFRVQSEEGARPGRTGDHFVLYKGKPLIDLYARLLSRVDFSPENVIELGIWDGGSTALWVELFGPRKHVAVDVSSRGDSDYFRAYVESRGLEERVRTYWETDQEDKERLREIVRREFDAPLDLVVDDASHLYEPTKASFEALFPLLRPGGLYVIEDWHWEHGERFAAPDHPWAHRESPTKLVFELVEATGTLRNGTVGSLAVHPGLVVAERGNVELAEGEEFVLAERISRRPRAISSQPAGPAHPAP